ncbi:3656_t:CDS:2, partial [Racocetra persica]
LGSRRHHINQQDVVCELACGGPHKYDLTNRNRYMLNLYTIGIQQYMTEIQIFMMEKRDVYRLHLLKSFNLPLSYSVYGNLCLALSWAWNIKGLVESLSYELDDRAFVTSITPERDPPSEMKTDTTPD